MLRDVSPDVRKGPVCLPYESKISQASRPSAAAILKAVVVYGVTWPFRILDSVVAVTPARWAMASPLKPDRRIASCSFKFGLGMLFVFMLIIYRATIKSASNIL